MEKHYKIEFFFKFSLSLSLSLPIPLSPPLFPKAGVTLLDRGLDLGGAAFRKSIKAATSWYYRELQDCCSKIRNKMTTQWTPADVVQQKPGHSFDGTEWAQVRA